jgi:hypothetical protein
LISRLGSIGRISGLFIALFASFFSTHCFFGGVKNTGKVQSYTPGLVKTEKGEYKVGILPESWQRTHIPPYRLIAFRNDDLKSTIETDAFCDAAFDDASLKVLTTHLHFDLTDKKIRSEKSLLLDQREALRTVASGKVDGVLIVLDTVVIKKDNCLFDFALVADPKKYEAATADFEKFFEGFRYEGEI